MWNFGTEPEQDRRQWEILNKTRKQKFGGDNEESKILNNYKFQMAQFTNSHIFGNFSLFIKFSSETTKIC